MPRRIEAGHGPPGPLSDGREAARSPGAGLRLRRRRLCRGALLAAPAALVAVSLDLARELLRDQVERRLGHEARGVGVVALLEELDLEHRQLAHLLAHLLEAPLDAFAQLVGDLKVASLDLDPHGTPLCRRGGGAGS